MEFVIEQVDQPEQNLHVDPAHQPLPSKPPVHHQPPHHEPELPGARVVPGEVPHYELGEEPTWSWTPGLAQGSGGSLQWGFPG
eukprot:6168860-Prorocentrum_lima.AAC.1